MTEREKMLAGEPCLATDPELVRARSSARRAMRRLAEADPDDLVRELSSSSESSRTRS